MCQLDKKIMDLNKVVSVVFSCTDRHHLDTAENMYYNWQKMYDDENAFALNLLKLKRKWFN